MNDVTHVTAAEAWSVLGDEAGAMLVDVRTRAEWTFVGVPVLSDHAREPVFIEWQRFPTMAENPDFATELEAAGATPDTPLLFICRSGARSGAAALLMAARGHTRCYNISDGFEGDLDPSRHRSVVGGWRAAGLPWSQG